MQNITMITGGTGAGKTAYALRLASEYKSKIYLATAEITDPEMQAKVDAHIAERDETYTTIEEPLQLDTALSHKSDVIIIDCVTFWVNNLLYYKKDCTEYFDKLTAALAKALTPVIIVTNEVGLGIIPADRDTRQYSKNLSKINRQIADMANTVIMMVSGQPLKVK